MKKNTFLLFTFILINSIFAKFNDDPPHLPVELIYFKADVYQNLVLLSWGTATELNNYGFVIERSTTEDFAVFENLGFVEGHGTSYNTWHYTFEDTTITIAGTYFYRLNQLDIDGNNKYSPTVSVVVTSVETPIDREHYDFKLNQNYPNPFNPETNIVFSITNNAHVSLVIYDVLGNVIKTLVDENLSVGNYNIMFDGENLSSGVYLYKLQVNNKLISKKMVLQK